ncbi:MAG: hypothetical protein ABSB19_08370 [Methylomonas sp.]|jgi:hypothetical protein
MISAVRQKLAEMDKTGCEWKSLHFQEYGKGVKLTPSEEGLAIKILVDGCMINDASTRCDCLYFYQKSKDRYAFLVELKGNNYQHALTQLSETIKHENIITLLNAAKPNKNKVIAVAIVSEKAKTNRPRKEKWEKANNLRLRTIPLADDKTFDLKELVKLKE